MNEVAEVEHTACIVIKVAVGTFAGDMLVNAVLEILQKSSVYPIQISPSPPGFGTAVGVPFDTV